MLTTSYWFFSRISDLIHSNSLSKLRRNLVVRSLVAYSIHIICNDASYFYEVSESTLSPKSLKHNDIFHIDKLLLFSFYDTDSNWKYVSVHFTNSHSPPDQFYFHWKLLKQTDYNPIINPSNDEEWWTRQNPADIYASSIWHYYFWWSSPYVQRSS